MGMHHGAGGWQVRAQGVMVGDHPVDAHLRAGRHFVHAAHAAVHGDDQARIAGGLQLLDAVQVQAVAIRKAVGDEEGHLGAELLQGPYQQGRGGDPVHVIVAVDHDAFMGFDGPADADHGRVHTRQQVGVRAARPGRIEAPGQILGAIRAAQPSQPRQAGIQVPGPGHGLPGRRSHRDLPADAPDLGLHFSPLCPCGRISGTALRRAAPRTVQTVRRKPS